MGLFGEHERNQIADAVAEVEQRTNAELVAVLAARSDDYRHHSIAWAAALALLMSAPLVFVHPSVVVVLSIQLALFCGLVLLFRIPGIARRLIRAIWDTGTRRAWRGGNSSNTACTTRRVKPVCSSSFRKRNDTWKFWLIAA